MSIIGNILFKTIYLSRIDVLITKIIHLVEKAKIYRLCEESSMDICYHNQGNGGITIAGDIKKFYIDRTSHLKSDTFIECSGGLRIGLYFHPGRGLTIFTINHNYENGNCIPYDDIVIAGPVVIKDFVWCGANVTIAPGVTVGEGAVIGAGSVVTKNVPDYAVVGGNPAKILKYRNIEKFVELKNMGKFY